MTPGPPEIRELKAYLTEIHAFLLIAEGSPKRTKTCLPEIIQLVNALRDKIESWTS